MRRLSSLLALCCWLQALAGCVSLNTVSLTQVPTERKSRIQSEASKFVVLFLSFNNNFVNEAANGLKSQCPGGKITGILTKDETVNYFLMLVHKRRVVAEAYCVKA